MLICNTKIDEYIGKVTTKEGLLSKLTITLKELKEKTHKQDAVIQQMRYIFTFYEL